MFLKRYIQNIFSMFIFYLKMSLNSKNTIVLFWKYFANILFYFFLFCEDTDEKCEH